MPLRGEIAILLGKAEAFLSRKLCATFPGLATIRLMRHLNGIHLSSTELEPIVKSIKKESHATYWYSAWEMTANSGLN